jgi:hypothetical protein
MKNQRNSVKYQNNNTTTGTLVVVQLLLYRIYYLVKAVPVDNERRTISTGSSTSALVSRQLGWVPCPYSRVPRYFEVRLVVLQQEITVLWFVIEPDQI